MENRDRYGLRKLFNLGADSIISPELAALQEKTVEYILDILKRKPGVILGDDVGMGKTFMAIGAAYYYIKNNPDKPVLIITPGWSLNKQWVDAFRKFFERNDIGLKLKDDDIGTIDGEERYIKEFITASHTKKIVIAPVNIFTTGGWKWEKSFFLNCWFRHRSLRNETRKKIMNLMGQDSEMVWDPRCEDWMWVNYNELEDNMYESLDRLYDNNNLSCISMNNAIRDLRYKALNSKLSGYSMFILDEAHKVKNSDTVRHQALVNILSGKYLSTLFLTATPFQLSEEEMFAITDIFLNGSISRDDCQRYIEERNTLKVKIVNYKGSLNILEFLWNSLRPDEVKEIIGYVEKGGGGEWNGSSEDVKEVLRHFIEVERIKDELEIGLKEFIIRNVKNKREYRREIIGSMLTEDKDSIALSEEHFLPFALWEKTLYELFKKKDRTFLPTVRQSLTSSYEALKESSLYGRKDIEILKVLCSIVDKQKSHPKMDELVENVMQSVEDGDKTLIFCVRVETAKTLKEKIEGIIEKEQKKKIRQLFQDSDDHEEAFKNYNRRFYNKQDNVWLYLQENYLFTLLPMVSGKSRINIRAKDLVEEVSRLYQRYNTTKKANYMYIKRIVEYLVFRKAVSEYPDWKEKLEGKEGVIRAIEIICSPQYIELGLNLVRDEDEADDGEADVQDFRTISSTMIDNVLRYPGIWPEFSEQLNKLEPDDRDNAVSALIKFLQRDRSFFINLKRLDERNDSLTVGALIPKVFKGRAGFDWFGSTGRFLNYYVSSTKVEKENMIKGLKESTAASVIIGETSQEARERIKQGFNTPFYPTILIALPLMQEGLDLQKECRRVIHYDLDWNPASLEQRVGRIDRINSLTSRMREIDSEVTLDIYYPYIKNTIDENIYKTVKMREKWFSFILGGTPNWDTFNIEEDVRPLPEVLCSRLQVDLGVK